MSPIELIIRDVDENGKVLAVGVSLEPASTTPTVPVFLSVKEMGAWIAGLFGRAGRRGAAAPEPEEKEPAS